MAVAGEIDRVLHGNALRSSGGRTAFGEWDWLDHVPRRDMRRLTGAGYFARAGLAIDEAADLIISRVPGVETIDDAIEWYVATALVELDERQADRAGDVPWHDLERPDDEWPDDDPLEPPTSTPDATSPVQSIELAPAECPTIESWDVEPASVFEPDARPTFYGSMRPARRVSSWDSSPDATSPRRPRRQHTSTWWAIRRWLRW